MKKLIVGYLLLLVVAVVAMGLLIFYKAIDFKKPSLEIGAYCSLFGVLGGIVYCLRGYYLHTAVHKDWDNDWNAWFFIRPILGGILGFVALIFIKIGLLMFSTDPKIPIATNNILSYFAVAFIAGYNVQNFLAKLEDIGKATLGIDKTLAEKERK